MQLIPVEITISKVVGMRMRGPIKKEQRIEKRKKERMVMTIRRPHRFVEKTINQDLTQPISVRSHIMYPPSSSKPRSQWNRRSG